MTPADLLAQIRDDIDSLTRPVDDPNTSAEDLVDIGTALSALASSAAEAVDRVKSRLRENALKQLNYAPGTVTIKDASVTVQPSRMVLLDTADISALQALLGADFDLFFEAKTSFTPRKQTAELILGLPQGPAREALLASVSEKEQTPRVSFKKV